MIRAARIDTTPICPKCGTHFSVVDSEVVSGAVGFYCFGCGGGTHAVRAYRGLAAEARLVTKWNESNPENPCAVVPDEYGTGFLWDFEEG